MRENQWPDPTPEEGEKPHRVGWIALAALVALAIWAARETDLLGSLRQSWRTGEISLPQVPDIDLRGRAETPPAPEVAENTTPLPDGLFSDIDGPITRSVSFKDCLALIADTANAMGVQPTFVEESANRRAARLSLRDGDVTITCAEREGTMTIAPSN